MGVLYHLGEFEAVEGVLCVGALLPRYRENILLSRYRQAFP